MERPVGRGEAREALNEVDRQRAGIAERIRLPTWYAILYGAALAALLVLPGLSARPGHELSSRAMTLIIVAAVIVLSMVNVVLGRAAGARLRTDRPGVHVSARRPLMVTGLIVLLGSAVTWITAEALSWELSIVLGLGIAGLAIAGRRRTIEAIRHDVRSGQVVAR